MAASGGLTGLQVSIEMLRSDVREGSLTLTETSIKMQRAVNKALTELHGLLDSYYREAAAGNAQE